MAQLKKLLCAFLTAIIAFSAIYSGGIIAENLDEDDFHDFFLSSYPVDDEGNAVERSIPDISTYPYTVSYIYTPNGTPVYARCYDEMSDSTRTLITLDEDSTLVGTYGQRIIQRVDETYPTNRFNCYSYALHIRDFATNTHYLASDPGAAKHAEFESLYDPNRMLYNFWNDSHFIKTKLEMDEVRIGDIILYFKNTTYGYIVHAGVVQGFRNLPSGERDIMVRSKFGQGSLFDHSYCAVPRTYTCDNANYPNAIDNGCIYFEFFRFYIDHNYTGTDGVNLGSSGHRSTCQCTGCNTTAVLPHKMSDWTDYTAQQHKKTCSGCNRVLVGSHNFIGWYSYSTTKHRGYCKECGRHSFESHSYTGWSSDDNTTHSRSCKCGRRETRNHSFSGWVNAGFSGHKKTCGDCGKSITQAHNYGTGSVCKTCGYSGPGVAPVIVPDKAGLIFEDRNIAF